MAVVSYTAITENAARGVTDINTAWTSFQTQSTNVTGANFRDEGLDELVLANDSATSGFDSVYEDTPANVATAAYTILTFSGTTFTLDNGGAGWTVGEGIADVRIRFATQWEYTFGTSPTPFLLFRVAYIIDGGALTGITNSIRSFQGVQDVAWDQTTSADINVAVWRDNFKYAWLLPYPADGASHTLNSVSIEILTNTATFSIGPTVLTAMRFLKSTPS